MVDIWETVIFDLIPKGFKEINNKNNEITYSQLNIILSVSDPSIQSPSVDNDESYKLKIVKLPSTLNDNNNNKNKITISITAVTIFGLRNGLETLSQLITWDIHLFQKSCYSL